MDGASLDEKPAISVATIYFCPDGEPVGVTTPSTNFRLAGDTTFFEILQGVCTYLSLIHI